MLPMSRAAGTTSPSTAGALYAQPCDVTLVKDLLRPWVISGDTKAGGAGAYVHAADLYSADPEELARRFNPAVSPDGSYTWYFLSPLRTKSPRDRRKVRAVADGTGCWHSEAGPKNVVDHLDGGRHVGYRRSFSFMRRCDAGVDVRAGWVMVEFHLHHDGLGRKVEGLVLCKMYRSPRYHGPAVVPDCGDDVGSGVSPSVETTFSCGKSKAVNDEDSNAFTSRRQRHRSNSNGVVGVATTTATAAPLLTKMAAGDNEVSGMNKEVVVDDEDLLASPPASKKMRVALADAESSGAGLALKAAAVDAPAAAAQLHCPQCGFHLAALQALVTLIKSKSGAPREDAGDSGIPRVVGY